MPRRDLPVRLRELARRARYLLFRSRYAAELEEEMRFHLAQREARFVEQGAAPLEAYYAARHRFGNPGNLQQRSRDMWGLHWAENAIADVRFAARRLRNRPGFAIATIVVAALGIGATTAVFSAIDAAFFRPLPFLRPEQLVTLTDVNLPFPLSESSPAGRGPHSLDILDVRKMTDLFSGVGAYAAGGLNLSDASSPRRVQVGVVTSNFFSLFGAAPQAGRGFNEDEGRPNGPRAAVLSDALWRDQFGGADMVGKSIELNGKRYSVIGIMRPGFNFPNESDLWIPLPVPVTMETFAPFRGYLPSYVVGRLAAGASPASASALLLQRWQRLAQADGPSAAADFATTLNELRSKGATRPLKAVLIGDASPPLAILMGAALLLLLIACSNVANLLISDAASRRREIALREVLGASRNRIVRQLLAESVLLALAGAALGIVLAPAALRVLRGMMPRDLAGVAPAELDLRVLAFAGALALATGLIFGLWPAFSSSRGDATETIKSGGGLGATAGGVGGARRVLIIIELALTVMLLVGSGLMLRSLDRVLSAQMGMNPEHVGTIELTIAGKGSAVEVAELYAMLGRLDADPGINGVGVVNDIPLRGSGGIALSIKVDGAPEPKPQDKTVFARYLMATGGYFKAMGIPFLRGRTLSASDDSLAPKVAVINMAMAKSYWPNTDPIGKTFHLIGPSPITVVGLVADVRERSLETNGRPQMYLPIGQQAPGNLAIVARSTLPPAALLARMREAVRAIDPTQAVYNARMMDDVISASVAPRRTNTILIAIFGALALALAAFGVYAVVSYGVTRRAREFGIRAALGATGHDIAALVAGEMASVVVAGLALGMLGAWGLSRVLASLLYGVGTHDVATFVAAPIVLVLPAAIAALVPARRAMRVDPTEVMRAE
jgi:putative ABC transport system permease protein